MCVEGNVIHSLVAFVIIFLCNMFLALIICMHNEGMENVSLAYTGVFHILDTFVPSCKTGKHQQQQQNLL